MSECLIEAAGRDATARAPRIVAMNLSWHLFPHPHPFSRGEKGASCSPPERGGSWKGRGEGSGDHFPDRS